MITATATGDTVVLPRLSLNEAIAIGLSNNLDIQLQDNQTEIARTNNYIGVAGGLPLIAGTFNNNESLTTLNQQLNNGTSISRSGAFANSLQTQVIASQLLYNGRRVMTTKRRLAELERLSQDQLNVQINNTIASIATTYYDVVRQQDYARTLALGIAVAEQQVRLITVRKSVGLANNADLFQAQIDLNALKQALLQQELISANTKADLLTLLNVKPDSAIGIADTILVKPSLPIIGIVDFIRTNPEVAAARSQINVNELLVREVAAQRYPSLSVNGGLNYNRNQNAAGFTLLNQTYGPFIGLGVTVPIYNGQIFKRQQRVAEIEVDNARLTARQVERNLESSAIKNYQTYQNTLRRIEQEQGNFKLTQDLVELVKLRYELRVATILEYRQAQQNFIDAGFRLVNLSFAAKAAEIELLRIGNRLGEL